MYYWMSWGFNSCKCAQELVVMGICFQSVQFSSVSQSCPTLFDPMNRSMPGLPVHHQLPEFTQTHVHWVGDAIQSSHSLSSPSPPAFNPSPASGSFPMSQFFASGGQSIGVSASASVLPVNIQDWFPWVWICFSHLLFTPLLKTESLPRVKLMVVIR